MLEKKDETTEPMIVWQPSLYIPSVGVIHLTAEQVRRLVKDRKL